MRKILLAIAGLLCSGMLSLSQTVSPVLISSSGESFKNTTYQLDWSVGEIMTETYTVTQNSLTQGFHQGKYVVTAIERLVENNYNIMVFPNPVKDVLNLKIDQLSVDNLNYVLLDMNGKIIQTNKIVNTIESLNFSGIAVGNFFLYIRDSKNNNLKSFKIIKQ